MSMNWWQSTMLMLGIFSAASFVATLFLPKLLTSFTTGAAASAAIAAYDADPNIYKKITPEELAEGAQRKSFMERAIYIPDILKALQATMVNGVVFEKCVLYGPAVIAISHCTTKGLGIRHVYPAIYCDIKSLTHGPIG